MLPTDERFFNTVKKHCRTYLSLGFRSPSWAALCLSKGVGGLGLIDPQSQQRALQLQCIDPLLHRRTQANKSFIFPYLQFMLTTHLQSPSASTALLFPGPVTSCPSPLGPLLQASALILPSSLNLDFSLHPSISLSFPLSSTCSSSV
ncbi:hypothetical protein CLU79DRAFT_865818, partial [Phycomyces nitens]